MTNSRGPGVRGGGVESRQVAVMPTHAIDSASTGVDITSASFDDGERVRAVFRHDLDEHLRFSPGLVVLTNTHLRFGRPGEALHAVPLQSEMRLRRTEHHGLCELTVTLAGKPVARFFFTLREQESATSLCEAFEKELLRDGVELGETGSPARTEAEELPEPPVADMGRFPLFRLLGLARQRLPTVALGGALTLAATGVGLIPPYLTMPLVDEVLVPRQTAAGGEPPYHRVALILAALGLSAVLTWVLSWGQGFVVARVSERISADLRVRTFSHLTRLSLEYFGRKRTGDLIARISSDTDHLCSFLSDTLIDFVTDVLMIVGTSIVLVSLDPVLALVGVGTFPVIAWLVLRIRQRLTSGFLRGGRVWSSMTNILADTIPGIRVVKAFTQESREIARFQAANADIVEANDRVNALWTFFWPLVAFLNQAALLVIWAVGSYRVLAHRITLGVLTAFIAYIGRFYARVESMSRMLTAMQKASAASRRLFEILDREPSVVDPEDPVALTRMDGRIAFENVSFRYGSRLVLDDVSFEIAPRTLVGIVGHTGSGKSTVSNLLCRFYDVSTGRITVDGVDIRKFLVQDYRGHIGIVLQDAFLFFGTIAENVAYGRRDADRSQVVVAARVARAHEFVLKLPEAYDTIVGERGQTLSGGERQRLAIARALLVDPTILILDEATSAVDVKTEREIQDALDAATRGRTTIAIAHRLTTLDRADVIIVLRDGAVVEIGSRAELLARGGEYARLYRGQAEAEAGEKTPKALDHPPEQQSLVDVRTLSFERDDDGQLCIRSTEGGADRTPVRVRRCFPLSDPGRFFAIVTHDGKERACIEDPRTLGAEVFALIQEELEGSEFLPKIERIEELRHETAKITWKVQTDRGLRTFAIDQDETIRRLPDGRRLVTDTDGMRYLIPEALEAASRALLSKLP